MEKGTFHTSPGWVETHEERVQRVPLPNQMPKGLDFAEIPKNALKSSTVETLITQNEDLMARLTVVLRKNNELEDHLSELETERKSLRTRFETLKEQYQILSEKDRMSVSRALQLTEENSSYKKQIEKLERLYSDVYLQAQSFQKRLQFLERNRSRVLKVARSLQRKGKLFDVIEQDLNFNKEELQSVRESLQIQQSQIVTNYETKLADVRSEIENMRAKVQERDQIFEEKVSLQNKLVLEQRQFESRSLDYQNQLDRISAENSDIRLELKEALVTNETQRQGMENLRTQFDQMAEREARLIEQVESLQALWNHKQKEWEQSEERNKALQKLNQNISITMNQQRKEIHGLQTSLDQQRFAAEEKIKTLTAEIQMLRLQISSDKNS